MSGNCATGMRISASAPAIVMTSAMTTASRGRSTKSPRSLGRLWLGGGAPLAPSPASAGEIAGGGVAGLGDTVAPGRTRCSPSLMTSFSLLEPVGDHGRGRRRLAELDAPLLCLVLRIDDIDVMPC